MKRKIFLLTLLILVAAFNFTTAMAQAYICPPVEICKSLHCKSAKPPYYVGNHYTWWIKITVTAHDHLSDVRVYDRLGAELMIDGIDFDAQYPIDINLAYDPYEWDGDVYVDGSHEGELDKEGVSFNGFHIYWTGKSVKAHFQWDIGAMSSSQTKTIYLIVSTDTNPAGWQEYTSCGWYWLNSGATVKATVVSTEKQFSDSSDGIEIYVSCEPCDA